MIGMMMQYRCPQKSQASRHLIAGPWRLMFIAGLAGCMASLLTAAPVAAGETLPCEVMVKFEDDDAGVATIYRLRLQHKNRKGRDVSHVSVMTATADGTPIGNSHVDCRVDGRPLRAGDTGECRTDLQVITGRMAATLNFEDWLGMIRDQQDKLATIKQCEILGVRYAAD